MDFESIYYTFFSQIFYNYNLLLFQTPSAERLSGSARAERLQDIFNRLCSQSDAAAGIQELYDFRQQYPAENLEEFMGKCTPFMRNFIERGLRNIELERSGRDGGSTAGSNADSCISHLKSMMREAGLEPQKKKTPATQPKSGECHCTSHIGITCNLIQPFIVHLDNGIWLNYLIPAPI